MRRPAGYVIGLAVALLVMLGGCAPARNLDMRADWATLLEEASLQVLHDSLSRAVVRRPTLITDVHIVDPESGTVSPPRTILLQDGVISAINPRQLPSDAVTMNGEGRYAVPGLCDMHVHRLTSTAQPLLNLLFGVTCVRDMGGYTWMLRARNQMRRGDRLEPRSWIAGPILTDYPMGWYSMVVESETEIRSAVARTAGAGYDFVKLHNSMRPERVAIVFDEAERIGIPVVGHTPHRTSLADMAAHARTIEHLKGYLVEPNLDLTTEDWEQISVDTGVWNTPTLYTSRANTERISRTESLVPAAEMRSWRTRAAEGEPSEIHMKASATARDVTRRLIELETPLLAGTDSGGGYPNLVYGEGLHEELDTFLELGMTAREALVSATTEAARALDDAGFPGQLIKGGYADLMLVESNPLNDLSVLRQPSLVCIDGRCLETDHLEALRSRLTAIFRSADDRGTGPANAEEITWWLESTRRLHDAGYIFRDNYLESAALTLEFSGRPDLAADVRSMATTTGFSFDTSHDELVPH